MTPQDLALYAQQADDFTDEILSREQPEWREVRHERFISLVMSHMGQEWKMAALRVGEELAEIGPSGYYGMKPEEWQDWALGQVQRMRGIK